MHLLILLSLFVAPVLKDPQMAADSLLAHTEAEQGKNRSVLGGCYTPALTSFIPQRSLRMMSNGRFRKPYF